VLALMTDLWRQHKGIIVILFLYLVLATVYSVVTPLFEASDEMWHYPFVKHLADGGGLPVQDPQNLGPWRQEGSQPPLYYALSALVSAWVDTSDVEELIWRNPHADIGLPTADGNINMVIHTEREAFPWSGTALAAHLVRLFSVLLGAVTVLATYLAAREINPANQPMAVGAAAFTAFNPMFLFVSGSVNNDNLVVALASLSFWWMLRLVRVGPSTHRFALLGVLLGLAMLSKTSGLGLLALAGLTVVLLAYQRRSWRVLFTGGIIIGCVSLAIGGWWYYRNWRLYSDPLGLNTFVAIVGARHPQPTLQQLWGERAGFTMSYWGFFGGMNLPADPWLYVAFNALAGLGIAGLGVMILREVTTKRWEYEQWARLLIALAWPAIVFVSLIRWTLMTIATQGRLMFSAMAAISVLLIWGLTSLVPRPWRWVPSTLAIVVALFAATVTPFTTIGPAYARHCLLTTEDASHIEHRLDADFEGRMALLGYDLESTELIPGGSLEITLYWRSLAPMPEDYSVFVHLLGVDDLIIVQRDTYPGLGGYPTSLWKPGDTIADRYVLRVPEAVLTPSEATIEVGLYRLADGSRLGVLDESGSVVSDNVRFARLTIRRAEVGDIPNPVYFNLDNKIALVGYDLDRTAAAPGEAFQVTVYWKALSKMDQNYSVFTQVLGEGDSIWAQKDSWPRGGDAPTSIWEVGQIVEDTYVLVVKEDAPAGAYDLQVGVYLGETGDRLSLLGDGGHVQDNRILLGKVRIVRP